ncbi:hypothetical protein GCM10007276_17700 [Agaricicola taiwanensis]|uniref:SH3b domain-containing protein n=1 Tax=Agaricicola taiwanensis TaxID=591372 RepID=A0A8J2VNN8_9RHOB|nr:SH3 domain-containing protein [Agaricicola taiwanensis]GGE40795.1 hypothetical protein GCM10007276_17700 [Agaricicola taiwanensis]
MVARTATLLSVLLLSAVWAADAQAYSAYATADLNVRSGPGTRYPVITTLRDGEPVEVISCAGSWCRLDFGGGQGFASASYLATGGPRAVYRPPVVVAPAPYFVDRYYYGSNNYRYRDRYRRDRHRDRYDRDRRPSRGGRPNRDGAVTVGPGGSLIYPSGRNRSRGGDSMSPQQRHERDGSNS